MALHKSSTRRILRDLKQWKQCAVEVPAITAEPLDNDLYEWHVNMTANDGLLKGITFHLIVNFPNNYPYSPPSIELCNYLKHPNVFKSGVYGHTKSNNGYWLCLDMLKETSRSRKYEGWTSAYSITSILMQLQVFLIGDKAEQSYGNAIELETYLSKTEIKKINNEASYFKCKKCNLIHDKISKILLPQKKAKTTSVVRSDDFNGWNLLYDDIENMILCFLTYKDCIYFNSVCSRFQTIVERNKIFALHTFGCWYNKIDLHYCQRTMYKYKAMLTDDDYKEGDMNSNNFEDIQQLNNTVLGYGFTPMFWPKLSKTPYFSDYLKHVTLKQHKDNENMKFIQLSKCDITFDLLSYDAFNKHKVRTTVWKEKNFTHFLPIYINKKHGIKSMKLFEKLCFDIFSTHSLSNNVFVPNKYHPMMGIHLVMTLMNSLVVAVKSCSDEKRKKPNLYYSINVIETYMHLYHLLLAIYDKYTPIISVIVDEKCMNFVKKEKLRTKKYISNFGTFKLNFILCDKYKWNDIVYSFVDEALIRNMKWMVQQPSYSDLRTVKEDEDKQHRINETWKINQKRGFLFQYFFLKTVCKIGEKTPLDKFKEFNDNFGCPPKGLSAKFQHFVKKIYSVGNIYEWFRMIELHDADTDYIYRLLANACVKSLKYGYHRETPYRHNYHRRRYYR